MFDVAHVVAGHADVERLVAPASAHAGEAAVGQLVGDEEEVLGAPRRPGLEADTRPGRGGGVRLHFRDGDVEDVQHWRQRQGRVVCCSLWNKAARQIRRQTTKAMLVMV